MDAEDGMRGKIAERDVLKACLDLLAVKKIWHRRMNTGAVKDGKRFFRFGSPGMADVLAIAQGKRLRGSTCYWKFAPLWVECKAPGGKQSIAQEIFQEEVVREGHAYLLVKDVDELADWLKARGL
jgi:hypothetical protein